MIVIDHVTPEKLNAAASEVVAYAEDLNLWTFSGVMGAGKTTLIKEICRSFGVQEEVSSPTFSLVNEYHTASGKQVYHFDFYRIEDISEVYDIGYEDYFYSDSICLIEWPEKISELLDGSPYIEVRIEPTSPESRRITLRRF